MEVVTTEQAGANGKVQVVKTLGKSNKAPDLSLVRMAPPDMAQDKLWGWFNDIRDKGMLLSDRTNNRKSGSIVMYDSTQRRDRQVQLHQRLAEQDLHRPAVRRVERPGEGDDHPDGRVAWRG